MSVIATRFPTVDDFLHCYRRILEQYEASHQILLDLCFYLKKFSQTFLPEPYFKVFKNNKGPLLIAAMARPYHLILSTHDAVPRSSELQEWIKSIARDILFHQWRLGGVIGEPSMVEPFVEHWENLTCSTVHKGKRLCIHQVSKMNDVPKAPGQLCLATMENFQTISQWLARAQREEIPEAQGSAVRETVESKIRSREIYFWLGPHLRPVSVVSFSRTALDSARLTLAYTPPEHREKGYAAATVAQATRIFLNSGSKLCVVISETKNIAATRLYESIGYTFVCEQHEYTFQKQKMQ